MIRDSLLTDELADTSMQARELRERGLHLVSTWLWDEGTRTATFWLRSDVVESMRKPCGWEVAVWRTDNWVCQGSLEDVALVRDLGVWSHAPESGTGIGAQSSA